MRGVRFQIVVVLEERRAAKDFVRYTLPTLLTSGNLFAFTPGDETVLDIYGSRIVRDTIATDGSLHLAGDVIGARFTELEAPDIPASVYRAAALRFAYRRPEERSSAMIVVRPTTVYADGVMGAIRKRLLAGSRVVFAPYVDATIGLAQELTEFFNPRRRASMLLAPVDLATIWHRYHVQIGAPVSYGAMPFATEPERILFPLHRLATIVHNFAASPDAFGGIRSVIPDDAAWNCDLALRIEPDPRRWAVIDDSDEGFMVDFGFDPDWMTRGARSDVAYGDYLARWLRARTTPAQRTVGLVPLTIHARPPGPRPDTRAVLQPIVEAAGRLGSAELDAFGPPLRHAVRGGPPEPPRPSVRAD